MKKNKATKRAIITCILSLCMCVTMFIGGTYAWFTDNAKTGNTVITAGTLDVELLDAEGQSLEGKSLAFEGADENTLWEPGCTFNLQTVTVKNSGNLAFKYKVEISGVSGDIKLNDVIDWTIDYGFEGEENVLKAGESADITISAHMQESAGNDYQGLTIDNVAIAVYATQTTVESDSNGTDYDASAKYDKPLGKTELLELFASASANENGEVIINLEDNYEISNWETVALSSFSGKKVIINGNGKSISGLNAPLFKGNFTGVNGVEINDLIIKEANIVAENQNGMGVGAIVSYIEVVDNVTAFNRCKVINSTIKAINAQSASDDSGCAGGIMGYTSTNKVEFNGCEVSDCTIQGTRYAGGLIGMTYGSTFTNSTIKGCTLSCNPSYREADDVYSGLIAGHTLVNVSVIDGYTVSGNNIDTLVGRQTVVPTIK